MLEIETMFQGLIAASLGHDGCFVMPHGWRSHFADGKAIVSHGDTDCWRVYPAAVWEAWLAEFTVKGADRRRAAKSTSNTIGYAVTVAMNKQGRIAIPASLRERIKIPVLPCKAVLAGQQNFFEVWCRENWVVSA
jgi:DNA-binding transcriptional regulator/RsmH inhibitor MraZ